MALLAGAIHSWDYLVRHCSDNGFGVSWSSRTTDGRRITRLMDAVVRRNVSAAKDIIPNIDVNAIDNNGRTALHLNFLQDPYTDADVQIARLLIEYGAPVNEEDHEGVTPASLASTPEQFALLDRAQLAQITEDVQRRAQLQRQHLKAQEPEKPNSDPTDPGFPQIQRPVKFKKPLM